MPQSLWFMTTVQMFPLGMSQSNHETNLYMLSAGVAVEGTEVPLA